MKSQLPAYLILEDSPRVHVTLLLHDLGIPANINGYHYLREAILCAGSCNSRLTRTDMNRIYLETAILCDATSSSVTQSISHAIKISGQRGNYETLTEIFGIDVNTQDWKMPNKDYIAKVAKHLNTAPAKPAAVSQSLQILIM